MSDGANFRSTKAIGNAIDNFGAILRRKGILKTKATAKSVGK